MKKIILIVFSAMLLTGCQSLPTVDELDTLQGYYGRLNVDSGYVSDEYIDLIDNINKIGREYSKKDEKNINRYLDIAVYDELNGFIIVDIESYNVDYMDEILTLLDDTVSPGIKEYVSDLKKVDRSKKQDMKRFGNTIVYIDESWGEINIHVFTKDIKDKDLKQKYEDISNDSYLNFGVRSIDENSLLQIKNINSGVGYMGSSYKINYNLFYNDLDLDRVLLLVEKKGELRNHENQISDKSLNEDSNINNLKLINDDYTIFDNIISELNLSKKDKEILNKEFENSMYNKVGKKSLKLGDYDIKIVDDKGMDKNDNTRRIYFSIEK